MTRDDIDALCAAHAGAALSGPGELDAWKVGGKMFACFGHEEERATNDQHMSVKCADVDTAQMLIDAGIAQKAPYFHKSWVRLPLSDLDPDEARHRIGVSYDTIASKLPKKTREAL